VHENEDEREATLISRKSRLKPTTSEDKTPCDGLKPHVNAACNESLDEKFEKQLEVRLFRCVFRILAQVVNERLGSYVVGTMIVSWIQLFISSLSDKRNQREIV
jgi:hypothetical protein